MAFGLEVLRVSTTFTYYCSCKWSLDALCFRESLLNTTRTEDFSDNILSDAQLGKLPSHSFDCDLCTLLDWIFLFLSVLYAFDLLVRFHGLGFRSFCANGWNLFDLAVVAGSFATTIPALHAASRGLPGNTVNTQLQKLFLVSIALKLVQRVSSLNQLFKTSV